MWNMGISMVSVAGKLKVDRTSPGSWNQRFERDGEYIHSVEGGQERKIRRSISRLPVRITKSDQQLSRPKRIFQSNVCLCKKAIRTEVCVWPPRSKHWKSKRKVCRKILNVYADGSLSNISLPRKCLYYILGWDKSTIWHAISSQHISRNCQRLRRNVMIHKARRFLNITDSYIHCNDNCNST